MLVNKLNKSDFYYLNKRGKCYILHIPTLTMVNLKENTEIFKFFTQLCKGIKLLDDESYNELESEVIQNFPSFVSKSEVGEDDDTYSLQNVILPISGKCNLRCSYCFAQNKGDFGFGDITPENCKEIVDYIMSHSMEEMTTTINFFGGEPMLRMDTVDAVVNYVSERYPSRSVNYGITTNGTLFTDKNIDYFKHHDIGILFSFDGTEEFASHRVFANGKKSNDLVLRNMQKLKDAGVNIQLRATVSSDCECLWKIHDYFENLGIPFAAVLAYKSRNIDDTCVYDSCLKSFKKQYDDLLNYYINRHEKGLPIMCMSIADQITAINKQEIRYVPCSSGKMMFAIVDNGDIFSCEHLAYDKKYAIGNVHEGMDVEKMMSYRPLPVNKLEKCNNCWAKHLCIGGCYSEKLLIGREKEALSDDECELKKMQWNFMMSLFIYLRTHKSKLAK